MPKKPAPKPDDPKQYKRFLESAREAEADETEQGADRAFRKVIHSPSKGPPKKRVPGASGPKSVAT
jgi:hypothetical protein